ncbi:MAG: hypothetical protein AAB903_00045, partial [Patescibacteria group bacterium]
VFNKESYWDSVLCPRADTEVDYIGTGGMIVGRGLFLREPLLENLPPEYDQVEDLYFSYAARKHGMRLFSVERKCQIINDGKDQHKRLGEYKEQAFKRLRYQGWKLLCDKK